MKRTKPLTFLFESVVIGAGIFLLNGVASAATDPGSQPADSTSSITTSNSTDIADSGDSLSVQDIQTQSSQAGAVSSDSNTIAPLQTAVTGDNASMPIGPIIAVTDPTAPILSAVLTTPTATADVQVPNNQNNVLLATSSNGNAVSSLPISSKLASVRYFSMYSPYSPLAAVPNQEESAVVPATTQSQNPIKTPVQNPIMPFGMVSAILSLFAQAVPASFINPVAPTTAGYVGLLIVLTMVALAVAMTARTTVVSYGTWLKITGYFSVARAGLPQLFSFFETPRLMGYVCALAPFS